MGYEAYLRAVGELDRPGHWYAARWVAAAMGREPKLVSAYLTRLFKMGLVQRRLYRENRRGRPAYRYRLSKRGREHLRWLDDDLGQEDRDRLLALLPRNPLPMRWTRDMDRLARRILRRNEGSIGHIIWVTMLTQIRAKCLGDPMSLLEKDWWRGPPKG